MKLLLDTHTFIWWVIEPKKLPKRVITACGNSDNSLILSVVSAWEMQIKIQLGKLSFNLPLKTMIESQQQTNSLQILHVNLAHVLALDSLPFHHKDPFDRLLIAQAKVEDAFLVSRDTAFSNYPVKLLW
ncbi:type II toxin-antitoxin system VapC family toxin [Candidatus Poribacteria bacterium]|nr:type II toxin-antitoxin system VapC family toxin [Candidatus Poribacteria bacterium]